MVASSLLLIFFPWTILNRFGPGDIVLNFGIFFKLALIDCYLGTTVIELYLAYFKPKTLRVLTMMCVLTRGKTFSLTT